MVNSNEMHKEQVLFPIDMLHNVAGWSYVCNNVATRCFEILHVFSLVFEV